MPASRQFSLPYLLGDKYMLTSVLNELPDEVVYAATQKDVRREVIIESLRYECLDDPSRLDHFLQSAQAQARFVNHFVASTLELFFAADTWHLVRERVMGEPLDMVLASGRRLSAAQVVQLLLHVCHGCIFMDIEGIACNPFMLEHSYLVEHGFRFDNPVCAGRRHREASRRVLRRAARLIHPLLDAEDPLATRLSDLLERMSCEGNWDSLGVLRFDEELTRIQMRTSETAAAAGG